MVEPFLVGFFRECLRAGRSFQEHEYAPTDQEWREGIFPRWVKAAREYGDEDA